MERDFLQELEQQGWTVEKICRLLRRLEVLLDNAECPNYFKGRLLEDKVNTLLLGWGFKITLKGFEYLQKAIIYIIENNLSDEINMNSFVYPLIAEMCGTTPLRVEKSIKISLNKAFKVNPQLYNIISENYSVTKLNDTDFILYTAKQIKKNLL